MLSTSSAFPLVLLATSAVAHSFGHNAHQHQARHARAARARRGAEPASLSEGSLTAAEGCTQWYNVKAGDSCYSAIATVEGGLGLEDFYAMNPQVDGDCFNLWTGYDYCVGRTTTSDKPKATKAAAVVQKNVEKVVSTTSIPDAKAAAVTTKKPQPTTTTEAAPEPTPEPTTSADDEEEEDCDAEDDNEEEEVATTTAAPVRAAVQATTQAPTPTSTADDSASRNSAIAAARSKAAADKASADAAWAASSSSSAAAAASSSSAAAASAAASKSSADAEWQRQQAVQTKTTASAAAQTTTPVFNGGSVNSKLAAVGIKTFLGDQTGAIASWFRTNSAQDSTNGNSWCYRPYDDSMPGFAPSLKTMLASFGGDPIAAGKAFCGQEAEFTTPDGRTATLFIADAFDDRWVLTPTSVDVVKGAFSLLYGSDTDNKNDVVQGVTWKLTGNKNPDYTFNNGNPV